MKNSKLWTYSKMFVVLNSDLYILILASNIFSNKWYVMSYVIFQGNTEIRSQKTGGH
jgi:hypothetical protein